MKTKNRAQRFNVSRLRKAATVNPAIDTSNRATYTRALEQFLLDGTGMCLGLALVAAMAIQNAIHRIHMGALPPTTVMTGNTIQVMIDLSDLARGASVEVRAAIQSRLSRMAAGSLLLS